MAARVTLPGQDLDHLLRWDTTDTESAALCGRLPWPRRWAHADPPGALCMACREAAMTPRGPA